MLERVAQLALNPPLLEPPERRQAVLHVGAVSELVGEVRREGGYEGLEAFEREGLVEFAALSARDGPGTTLQIAPELIGGATVRLDALVSLLFFSILPVLSLVPAAAPLSRFALFCAPLSRFALSLGTRSALGSSFAATSLVAAAATATLSLRPAISTLLGTRSALRSSSTVPSLVTPASLGRRLLHSAGLLPSG